MATSGYLPSEWIVVVAAVIFWIWWHVRCIHDENRAMNEAVELYRRIGVDAAMHPAGKGQLPDNVRNGNPAKAD